MTIISNSCKKIHLIIQKLPNTYIWTGEGTLDFLTCISASNERNKTIHCGRNERIRVRSTVIAVLPTHVPCMDDEVLLFLRNNVTDSCKFHDPLSFTRYVVTKIFTLGVITWQQKPWMTPCDTFCSKFDLDFTGNTETYTSQEIINL